MSHITPPRRRLPAADRRVQLLEVADTVLGADAGASMDVIAAAAGVTKPVLYRHFRDKAALYEALVEGKTALIADLVRGAIRAESDPRAQTKAAIEAYLGLLEEHPAMYRLLTREAAIESPAVAQSIARFNRRLGDELAEVIAERFGLVGPLGPLAPTYAHALVGMVHSAGDYWFEHRQLERSALAESLIGLIWGDYAALAARAAGSPGPS